VLLWSFFVDHARAHKLDVAVLAREQLEAFIAHGAPTMNVVSQH